MAKPHTPEKKEQSLAQHDMCAEQQREEEEYGRILESARNAASSPGELYGDSHILEKEEDAELLSPLHSSMDSEGNPTWISLAPLERDIRYDSIHRDTVEDFSQQDTMSSLSKRLGRNKIGRGKDEAPFDGENAGLSGRTGRRGQPKGSDNTRRRAARETHGRGSFAVHKPRPMRGLVRMLLVTAALGLFYHFLAGLDWVPKLW